MSQSRFTAQASTAEDLLKTQTVGLVNLSDFRKRRAEALEQSERDSSQPASGAATPSDRGSTPQPQLKKKRKAVKGALSFGVDDGDDQPSTNRPKAKAKVASNVSEHNAPSIDTDPADEGTEPDEAEDQALTIKRRLGHNTSISHAPKVMTKSALLKDAQTREELRKEFLTMQETVKATEIVIPFMFYDGTNVPGGTCRVKKGDYIWVFLDKCRRIGAERAVGALGEERNRKEWARVGVDDLILVRGELIIPHHYDFYYFIVNGTVGYGSQVLFNYSAEAGESRAPVQPSGTIDLSTYNPLSRPGQKTSQPGTPGDSALEGANDDPNFTKVVTRRWYERHKHIYPASTWEEFDPTKDYTNAMRRDAKGNAYFLSG